MTQPQGPGFSRFDQTVALAFALRLQSERLEAQQQRHFEYRLAVDQLMSRGLTMDQACYQANAHFARLDAEARHRAQRRSDRAWAGWTAAGCAFASFASLVATANALTPGGVVAGVMGGVGFALLAVLLARVALRIDNQLNGRASGMLGAAPRSRSLRGTWRELDRVESTMSAAWPQSQASVLGVLQALAAAQRAATAGDGPRVAQCLEAAGRRLAALQSETRGQQAAHREASDYLTKCERVLRELLEGEGDEPRP